MDEDRWQGYPEQRQELLDFIAESSIENVWFLAGDFHMGPSGESIEKDRTVVSGRSSAGPGGSSPSRRITLAETDPAP